jgi:hypothetical protein
MNGGQQQWQLNGLHIVRSSKHMAGAVGGLTKETGWCDLTLAAGGLTKRLLMSLYGCLRAAGAV